MSFPFLNSFEGFQSLIYIRCFLKPEKGTLVIIPFLAFQIGNPEFNIYPSIFDPKNGNPLIS